MRWKSGLCKSYLKEDKSLSLKQNCHGNNICEHCYSNLRLKNNNIDKKGIDSATTNATNHRANAFNMQNKTNTAGDKIRVVDVVAPLIKGENRKTYK